MDYCYKEKQNLVRVFEGRNDWRNFAIDLIILVNRDGCNLPTILICALVKTALLNYSLLLLILQRATSRIDLKNSLFWIVAALMTLMPLIGCGSPTSLICVAVLSAGSNTNPDASFIREVDVYRVDLQLENTYLLNLFQILLCWLYLLENISRNV